MQGCPFDIQTPNTLEPDQFDCPAVFLATFILLRFHSGKGKWYDFISFILKNCSSLGVCAPIIELRVLLLLTDAPV
jgi:hypothetical protein